MTSRPGASAVRIQALGHAGLRVESDSVSILLDPWLSVDGAFLASWFPFPRNDHLDVVGVVDCDWAVVSHEHLDHMDLGLLRRMPRRTRVLVPRYPAPLLRRRLVEAGVANVVELPPWQRFPLDRHGNWAMAIPETSPMCHDAAVLLHVGGTSVLHVNDARLTVAQVRRAVHEAGGEIAVLALQASGASWHPICYEYPEEQLLAISAQKRVTKFRDAARVVRAARPQVAVVYAGPPCFLDPDLRHHNRWMAEPGIFPVQAEAVRWLQEHLPGQAVTRWLPGDVYDVPPGRLLADPRWEGFDETERSAVEAHLDAYAADRAPIIQRVRDAVGSPDKDLAERFAEHMRRLGSLSPYFAERIAMTVRFDVRGDHGGIWDVSFGPTSVDVDVRGRAREVAYRFTVDSRWLLPVLDGRLRWEDLLLSLRFSAWREPDVYNDYLVGLLKHADAQALAAVEAWERGRQQDERIVVTAGGEAYEIDRYCPHAGQDLSDGAIVVGDTIRCFGHNFEFDLRTGSCRNARCRPLRVRHLGAAHRRAG